VISADSQGIRSFAVKIRALCAGPDDDNNNPYYPYYYYPGNGAVVGSGYIPQIVINNNNNNNNNVAGSPQGDKHSQIMPCMPAFPTRVTLSQGIAGGEESPVPHGVQKEGGEIIHP